MQLNREDEEIISQTDLCWAQKLPLSIGNFYVKEGYDQKGFGSKKEDNRPSLEYPLRELIAYIVGRDLNLIVPKVYLAKIDDRYYSLSEDLNNYGYYESADYLGMSEYVGEHLPLILNFIEEVMQPYEYVPVLIDCVKTYLFDFFLSNWDRNPTNYGVLFGSSSCHIALIDHEFCLDSSFSNYISARTSDKKNTDDVNQIKKMDIAYFLDNYPVVFCELFRSYHQFLTPNYFQRVLALIEQNYEFLGSSQNKKIIIPKKEELITAYQENYDIISKTMEDHYERRKKLSQHNRN